MDGTTTPWDDRSFAFLGDIVRGLIMTVMFPEDAFDEVTTRTRTIDYMVQHQEKLIDATFFPMATPQDEQSEEVTTRKLMFLPAVYVPLLINSRGYTAKEVWASLYPAIVQHQELDVCAPLLKWLQVASTGAMRPAPVLIGDPVTSLRLIAPPADEVLLSHRHEILHQVLPALSAPPQALEMALAQMAAAIITQTNDQRQVHEQRLADEQEAKLPSTRFTVTLPVLMEYLQIDDECNLPEIWHSWSNCTKRQELQVLRNTLDAFARTPDAYSTTVPLVSARLTQDMLNFNFVGHSVDDLLGGLHPFLISDSNTEQRQSNLEVARLYGLLTSGDAMCSLADLEALQAKEVQSIPITYWELESNIGMFGNLVSVLLGTTHPLMVAYRHMWTLMQSQLKADLHTALEYHAYVKPAHLLRSIQMVFYAWFTHRRARLTPPTPEFATILQQIIMQTYILPTLPPKLYHMVYPKKTYTLPSSLPSSVATSVSSSTTSRSTSSGGTSVSSIVSGLTSASGQGLNTITGRGARISNLSPISTIVSLVPSAMKLKDLIGTTNPPTLDTGRDMCLSFLLKNGCWSNCKRAAQHTATLTTAARSHCG
jgi:hypothetical protein